MWFTENAWQPMLLFTLLAMIAGMVWYRRLQSRYLISMTCCLIIVGATWGIERSVVTARERVHDSVTGIVTAFQQRDLDRTVSYVSKQSEDLKLLIGTAHNLVEVKDDMRLTAIETELLNQNTRAKSKFRVNATVKQLHGDYTGHQSTHWETTWQLEEGDWRLINILQLDPVTGNVITDFLQERSMISRSYGRR